MDLDRVPMWVRVAAVVIALLVVGWFVRGCLSGELRYARVGPKPGAGHKTLILLHGYGAKGDDMVSFADEIEVAVPGLSLLVPEGSERVDFSGRSWIPTISAPNKDALAARSGVVLDGVAARVGKLVTYARERGADCSEIYVGGFSQGGRVAAETALRLPPDCPLGGLVLLSPGRIGGLPLPSAAGRPRMRVLVSQGTHDGVVQNEGRLVAQHFAAGRHDVRLVTFEGGHQIPDEVRRAVGAFMRGEDVGERVEPEAP
jgi:phospholipase/carboxylesterase